MNYLINKDSNTKENFKNTIASIGNIKSTTTGYEMIGTSFKSRRNFPKLSECESPLVKKGEVVKVVDYDESSDEYIIINVSMNANMDVNHVWFRMDESELNYILKRANN